MKKVLTVTLLILGVIIIGELAYYFLYQPPKETYPQSPTIAIPTEPLNQNSDYLLGVVAKAKTANWQDSIKGLSFFSQPPIGQGCVLTPGCISLDNTAGNGWWAVSTPSAVLIKSSFVLKVSLQNKNDLGGILLYGKRSEQEPYWKNIKSIFLGVADGGLRLYSDLHDGTSEVPIVLFDQRLDEPVTTFYVFFDQTGKNILLADNSYKTIKVLDVNKITGNKFPQGLFPESELYMGYAVAPYSSLSILELAQLAL